jgi:hypothetical protein
MGVRTLTYADLEAKYRRKAHGDVIEGQLNDRPSKSDREILFEKLDAKGIEYKKNQKTSELEELLEA